MVVRVITLYILLGHVFIAGIGSECIPVQCLMCDTTGETLAVSCPRCLNFTCINDAPSKCKKAFQVSINTTGSKVNEGDTITLTCHHNIPDLFRTFEWMKDGKVERGQNESKLVLKAAFSEHAGQYTCNVNSSCGSYTSSPHRVDVSSDSVLILVFCGVSALTLVLIMGLAMKFKLKRDNLKHRERMNRRAHVGQSGGPAPITPRES